MKKNQPRYLKQKILRVGRKSGSLCRSVTSKLFIGDNRLWNGCLFEMDASWNWLYQVLALQKEGKKQVSGITLQRLNALPLRLRARQVYLLITVMKDLATAIRQEKERKVMRRGKEEITLFIQRWLIVHVENERNLPNNPQTSEFSKVTQYGISMQKSFAFLYTDYEQMANKIL